MKTPRTTFVLLFLLRIALLGVFGVSALILPKLASAQSDIVDYDTEDVSDFCDDEEECDVTTISAILDTTTATEIEIEMESYTDNTDLYDIYGYAEGVAGDLYADEDVIWDDSYVDPYDADVLGEAPINLTDGAVAFAFPVGGYLIDDLGDDYEVAAAEADATLGPPDISSKSPAYAFVGTSGTLTLGGDSFVNPFGGVSTDIGATHVGGAGSGFTFSGGSVSETSATADYTIDLTATTGGWSVGLSWSLGGTFFNGVTNFTVGDPTPSVTSVNPDSLTAGVTTSVTLSGSYFGSNPQLTVSGGGATATITSHSDSGAPGGAKITANVTVPACAAAGTVTFTVTSTGYNGTGFTPAYAGQPDSDTGTATIVAVGGVRPLAIGDAPQIMFVGKNVAGTTTKVVVGQQIALTGVVPAQACVSVEKWNWTAPTGTAVGGYTPTSTSYATGSVKALPASTANPYTFYWVYPGTFTVSTTYTLTNDQTSPPSTATFTVSGPTVPGMTSALGNVNVTGTTLELGTPPRGAVFTGSAKTLPSGGTFQWVQLIQNSTVVLTPITGSVSTCSAGTGLDNVYPYSTGNPTDDNPNLGLQAQYSEETDTFAAQMYLMWSSGLTGSIPVPLGSVVWSWSGDAVQNVTKHTWSEKAGTGTKSAGAFQASTASQPSDGYPRWTSVVVNGHVTCH